jgi:Cytochrome c554 and c-prime
VKTYIKIPVFLLSVVLGPVILIGRTKLNQATPVSEKYTGLQTRSKSIPLQEKVKYRFVGMEKCASECHNNEKMGFQYNIMKNSPHSNAFIILNSGKALKYAKKTGLKETPHTSQVCLKCHVTGGGLDSSFFASTYRKEEGVTCESCHKGAFISKAFIPKPEDCLNCHNDSIHRIPHFNFIKNSEKISHPRPKVISKETELLPLTRGKTDRMS